MNALPNVLHDSGEELTPLLQVVPGPADDRLENALLAAGQPVAGDQPRQLVGAELQKLLHLHQLAKVLVHKRVGLGEQLADPDSSSIEETLENQPPVYRREWRSAKARMPKQLVGWSWASKKSEQACETSCSWSKLAAGSNNCTFSCVTGMDCP